MANQDLIDYQNNIKTANTAKIGDINQTITTIDEQIILVQANITEYESQKVQSQTDITNLQANNIKIDETITILSQ